MPQQLLDGAIVDMVPVVLAIHAIAVVSLGRKHPLPPPGSFQGRVLASQGRRQLHAAGPTLDFTGMLSLPLCQLDGEVGHEALRDPDELPAIDIHSL